MKIERKSCTSSMDSWAQVVLWVPEESKNSFGLSLCLTSSMNNTAPPPPSTETSTPPISSSTVDQIIHLFPPISTKLNQSNYLTWQSKILPLIHDSNLPKYIDSPPPSPTITNESGQLLLNPDYTTWHRQDQLLLGWLRSSLTESIQAQVVSSLTSPDLWQNLCVNPVFVG